MLRSLESITRDTQSVTGTVGVILMVAIALVAATTLQVYVGQMGDSDRDMSPMVSMTQSGEFIIIINVQFGPIPIDEITFKIFDDVGYICDGTLSAAGEHLAGGDTVTFSFQSTPGEKYLVRAIYSGSQVGRVDYIAL